MRFDLLLKAMQAWRAGRIGDFAAYKSAALAGCANATFGHAYLAFMTSNALNPLAVSPPVASELAGTNVLAVRYPMLHDAFHVLLGFDTSLPGELGVWAFVAAQHYSPTYDRAAATARLLYPLAAPTSLAALRQAHRRGLALAREAPCLIAQPLEQWWHEPLEALRRRLRIDQ